MAAKQDSKSMMPGVGEGIDMMRKMWGISGLPGLPSPAQLASMAVRLPRELPSMIVPTLDIDELDKRIADLRAVEQWLDLNAAMLRTTIQTLEVQRATIATLKGLSGAMMAPMTRKAEAAAVAGAVPPEVIAGLKAMATEPAAAPQSSVAVAPAATRKAHSARKRGAKKSQPAAVDAPLNPGAWWNTLQDQFARIAASAAQAAAAANAPAPAPGGTARKSTSSKSRKKAA